MNAWRGGEKHGCLHEIQLEKRLIILADALRLQVGDITRESGVIRRAGEVHDILTALIHLADNRLKDLEISLVIRQDYVRERLINAVADAVKAIIPDEMLDARLKKFAIKL